MITNVNDAPSIRTRLAAAVAAVLLLLVAFAPMLLLGESFSAIGLILIGAGLIGVGLLARARGDGARTFGTIVVIMGALILAAAIALMVLLMGGLGRGV
jgi:hypothetical protein